MLTGWRGLAVGVALAASLAPAAAADHVRACGGLVAAGDHYRALRAYDTGCARARSLVRAWARKDDHDGGWVAFERPAHWRCRLFNTSSGQLIRCKTSAGPARATFRPGFGP